MSPFEKLMSPVAGEKSLYKDMDIARTRMFFHAETFNAEKEELSIMAVVKMAGSIPLKQASSVKVISGGKGYFIQVLSENGGLVGTLPEDLGAALGPLIDSGQIKIVSVWPFERLFSNEVELTIRLVRKKISKVLVYHHCSFPELNIRKDHLLRTSLGVEDAIAIMEAYRKKGSNQSVVQYIRQEMKDRLSDAVYRKIISLDPRPWKYHLLEIFEHFAVNEEEHYWKGKDTMQKMTYDEWDYLVERECISNNGGVCEESIELKLKYRNSEDQSRTVDLVQI